MGSPKLLFWLIILGSTVNTSWILPDILLPGNFLSGSDFFGCLRKSFIVAAYLGIALFVIFFWSTVLAVKPHNYQVNLQQISDKIKTFEHEIAEIVQKIADWEQKISENEKHITESKKQTTLLCDEANKLKDNIKTIDEGNGILKEIAESIRVALKFRREEAVETQVLKEDTCLRNKREQLQQKLERQRNEHSEFLAKSRSLENTQNDLERTLTEKNNKAFHGSYESNFEEKSADINEEVRGGMKKRTQVQMASMMDVSQAEAESSPLEGNLKQLQSQLRSLNSTKCNLEECQKQLQNDRKSLRSARAAKEEELETLRMKLEIANKFYQEKKMSAEKELERENQRRQEAQKELSAAEEKQNLFREEVKNYKQRTEELKKKIEQAENSFREQIALYEKEEYENWVRACDLERAAAEESRKAAHLKHRLDIIQVQAQEGCGIQAPAPGRPDLWAPPCRDAGPSAAPRENSNIRSPFPAERMGEVNMAARGPPRFQGPPFMHYRMGGPPYPPMGYRPPPPPWWALRPPPLRPPPPFGPIY